MDVFISWSGERSHRIAEALSTWLPKVVQSSRPWISSSDIDAGTRWSQELDDRLASTRFGIICLTPENTNAPWVLFEAGALDKTVMKARVVPYLVGIEPHEIKGPLARFQAVKADEAGTLTLLRSMNNVAETSALASDILSEALKVWWPRLSQTIDEVLKMAPEGPPAPKRQTEDLLGEILGLLRGQTQQAAQLPPDPPAFTPPAGSTLGQRVLFYRTQREMSQAEVGRLAQVSNTYISNVENGRYFPGGDTLVRLANALGVQVQDLTEAV